MRIIAGSLKGKPLTTPKDEKIRPTIGRVKEGVFSSIQFELQNSVFIDLFSGTGQMGIEALSRGAKRCFFIDSNREAAALISKNIENCSFSDRAEIKTTDYESFLNFNNEKFDICYIDPPFGENLFEKAIEKVSGHMGENGIILCESDKKQPLPENISDFKLKKEYFYGNIKITRFGR